MNDNGLMYSHKPQVLRLHQIEEQERNKFCSDFHIVVNQILPSSTLRKIKLSPFLTRLLAVLPDAYYTLVTTLRCRRRLGEQYTYIAMYKSKHYQYQGVLMNKKSRTLLVVLQLLSRHLIIPSFSKLTTQKQDKTKQRNILEKYWSKIQQLIKRYIGSGDEIMVNVQWLILMLFMLNWNRRYTLLESILGISYVYTYKSQGLTDVSYKIQGYLILITLVIKALQQGYRIYQQRKAQKERERNKSKIQQPRYEQMKLDNNEKGSKSKRYLSCTICTCEMTNWSATKCGHLFCWQCIIEALQNKQECPICRTRCFPRQVVQLKNY